MGIGRIISISLLLTSNLSDANLTSDIKLMNCFSIAIYNVMNNCYRKYVECINDECYNTLMAMHILT